MGKVAIILKNKEPDAGLVDRWLDTEFVPLVGDFIMLDGESHIVLSREWATHRSHGCSLSCYLLIGKIGSQESNQ